MRLVALPSRAAGSSAAVGPETSKTIRPMLRAVDPRNLPAFNKIEHDVTQKPVPTFWHHALAITQIDDVAPQ